MWRRSAVFCATITTTSRRPAPKRSALELGSFRQNDGSGEDSGTRYTFQQQPMQLGDRLQYLLRRFSFSEDPVEDADGAVHFLFGKDVGGQGPKNHVGGAFKKKPGSLP